MSDKGATPWFSRFARSVERLVGRPTTFGLAVAVVLIWFAGGPYFEWSDTYQLVINTGTTIVTFLMVFVIQSTQNRDTRAMQVKLDELLKVNQDARNSLIDLEERPDAEIDKKKAEFANKADSVNVLGQEIPLGSAIGNGGRAT